MITANITDLLLVFLRKMRKPIAGEAGDSIALSRGANSLVPDVDQGYLRTEKK